MRKYSKYIVETDFGMTVDYGRNIKQATVDAKEREGQYFQSCRLASKEDLAWVAAMGGRT